jgi:hypothetical protein
MPNDPGEVNEFEGPALVTAVNMDPPLALYIYCGAIELERLDGPWLNA